MTDEEIGLVFDIGDTLIPAAEIQENAIRQTAQMLERRKLIDNADIFVTKYRDSDTGFDGPAVNHLFSIPSDIMSRTLRAVDVPQQNHLYAALAFYRKKVEEQIHRDDRLIDVLLRLKRKGYKLGILSDGTVDEQRYTLSALGIIDLLDTIVISEAVDASKPDKRVFQPLIQDFALAPGSIFIVGDDLERDIAGGKACGLRTIWVTEAEATEGLGDDAAYIDIQIERSQVYAIDSVLESFLKGETDE